MLLTAFVLQLVSYDFKRSRRELKWINIVKESTGDYFQYFPEKFIEQYALEYGVKKDDIAIMSALLLSKSYQEIVDEKG